MYLTTYTKYNFDQTTFCQKFIR